MMDEARYKLVRVDITLEFLMKIAVKICGFVDNSSTRMDLRELGFSFIFVKSGSDKLVLCCSDTYVIEQVLPGPALFKDPFGNIFHKRRMHNKISSVGLHNSD